MEPESRVYTPGQRPDVEVLVDGQWVQGELRAWSRHKDQWWANVVYRTAPGAGTYSAPMPTDQVREDTVDTGPTTEKPRSSAEASPTQSRLW